MYNNKNNAIMRKICQWAMAAALICGISFGATACSSSDDESKKEEALTPQLLAGLWVAEYAENKTAGDLSWTRVVEDYLFRADGTGYYECYLMNGDNYAGTEYVRGEGGDFHYVISGNTATVTIDKTGETWPITYADGKIIDDEPVTFQKATTAQQTLVEQLYAEWQKANSGTGGDDDNNGLSDVNGNADVNNGGGGVNVVR